MGDPLALVVLGALVAQGALYLIDGIISARRRVPGASAARRLRQELSEWGVIEAQMDTKAPGLQAMLRSWAGINARSRIGMGLGILLAAGMLLALLRLLTPAPFSTMTPLFVLIVTFSLQGFSFGMFAGNTLGLLIGAWRVNSRREATPQSYPARADQHFSGPGAKSRLGRFVWLPGALFVIDVLLVGGLNLLYLVRFTQAEFWSLIVFPAVMLLICLLGAWGVRRVGRLPPLRLTSDAALAGRADARARAHIIGMMLETQVYSLFILVVCQWLVQAFSLAHPGGVIYNGVPLVYAVMLFSLRGLLERAQR